MRDGSGILLKPLGVGQTWQRMIGYCTKDDGLPHTLEHAVFMGSELYPFKGILDKLANRCLADGTNAWTATDHTCCDVGDGRETRRHDAYRAAHDDDDQ